jgi:hypothetical protein
MKGQIKYATFFYRHVFDKVLKITPGKIYFIIPFLRFGSAIKELTKVGYHLEVIFDRDDIGHPNRANFLQFGYFSSVFSSLLQIMISGCNNLIFSTCTFLVPPTIFLTDLK